MPPVATTTSGRSSARNSPACTPSVKRDSGASNEDIHHFFAEGMLLNVAAALELGWHAGDVVAERLPEQEHAPKPDAGGAA